MAAHLHLHLPVDLVHSLAQLGDVAHERGYDAALGRIEVCLVLDGQPKTIDDEHAFDLGRARNLLDLRLDFLLESGPHRVKHSLHH